MIKWENAAGAKRPAANEKFKDENAYQDFTINPDKSKEEIHRSPIRIHRQPDQLPPTLKQLNQWCISGWSKEPVNSAGYKMDVTNPDNFMSFTEAVAASTKLTCAAGLGFVLTGSNIVTVDVDHCYNEGELSDVAMELLKLIPSYVELSQSKTGLHLIYLDDDIPAGFTGKKGIIEIYADKRYIALTGWKLPDSTADLTALNGMTKQLLDTYFPVANFTDVNPADTLEQHSYSPVQSNEAVLQSLQSNQKFQRLYAGDISGYPSQSEADGALMLILATATALNATQMRWLFSQSALGKRDKWVNRSWYQDYLIAGAINFVNSLEENNMDFIMFSNYDQQLFEAEQASYAAQSTRLTGFPTIDKFMGFPPGLYCLAAITSAGKTAFSIQLGHQLALQNNTVIYVGYETTPLEVYSRILARSMKQLNPASDYSAHDIRKNACADDPYYMAARQQLRQLQSIPFGFLKLSYKDNVDQLLEKLQHYITRHSNDTPPVVIVDYIQIIPHTGDVKNMLDISIPKIKQFQQTTGSTFILISSTNRASYRHDMGIEAFKESGVIEFSADVIWVLQYSVVNNGGNLSSATLEIEKHRSPRKMTLKCLKNRFGADYEVMFDYHSKFDWFVETADATDNQKEWKTATQI